MWKTAKRAAKRVIRSTAEKKYVFFPVTPYGIPALSYVARSNIMLMPAEGLSDTRRIGDQVDLTRFSFTVSHYYDPANGRIAGTAGYYRVRFLLVQYFPMDDTSTPGWNIGQLFQNGGSADHSWMDFYNWDQIHAKDFRIIKDWTVSFSPTSLNHAYKRTISLTGKQLRKRIRFNLASTTEQTNSLWIVTCTDADIAAVNMQMVGRTVFIDV